MIDPRATRPWCPPPAASWHLRVGAVLAPGRVVTARLGGGADHEVFLVRDAHHGRCVAKVVRPDVLAAGFGCQVLTREASALSAARADGVVGCLDVELHGARPHLLLEYVPGPTLRERLRRRARFDVPAVAGLGAQLATTLALVAERGWVHLDVKPENIVLGPAPCLLDFSIAKRAASAVTGGQPVGTPAYMAPEQRGPAGTPLGPAADVHALATTLVEVLTGEPAPRGVRAAALPAPFESTLGPALSPSPQARPTAAELARDLYAIHSREDHP